MVPKYFSGERAGQHDRIRLGQSRCRIAAQQPVAQHAEEIGIDPHDALDRFDVAVTQAGGFGPRTGGRDNLGKIKFELRRHPGRRASHCHRPLALARQSSAVTQ